MGVIQEIGENDKGLKPGDRVALEPYVPCNKCHMCAAGRFNNCADLHVCGVHKDGMMSEYFLHPVQLLYKLPDELTFTHAALVEPLTIGLHGAARARVSKGEHCAVFGAGIIGLMAAFACINYGATPYWWMCCKSVWITQRSWGYHAPLIPGMEMWRSICGR